MSELGSEQVRYPEVVVSISDDDSIMLAIGKVTNALRAAGHQHDAPRFLREAMTGDRQVFLAVVRRWVKVE